MPMGHQDRGTGRSFRPEMGTRVAPCTSKATKVEAERPSMRKEGYDRRSNPRRTDEITPVRLTRKYAERLNGVNLAGHDVGDRLPLSSREAGLLIAEGWAAPTSFNERRQADLIGCAARDRRQSR